MADNIAGGNGNTLGLEEEDRLPWLESADDYTEYNSNGGRTIGIVLIGLLILAGLIAAIFWMQGRSATGGAAGDGSLIAAENGKYKIAPKDPEGKQFEGTGDASFVASEGEAKEAKLAGSDKPPTVLPSDTNGEVASAGSVPVQLGAYNTQALAEKGWSTLTGKYDFVGKLPKKIVSATVDGGTVYRLSAIAPTAAAASDLCVRIKSAGGACLMAR